MSKYYRTNEAALDNRAKANAKRHGLIARKSFRRTRSPDNLGGYALIDPALDIIVYGRRFGLTAQDVIDIYEQKEK